MTTLALILKVDAGEEAATKVKEILKDCATSAGARFIYARMSRGPLRVVAPSENDEACQGAGLGGRG